MIFGQGVGGKGVALPSFLFQDKHACQRREAQQILKEIYSHSLCTWYNSSDIHVIILSCIRSSKLYFKFYQ